MRSSVKYRYLIIPAVALFCACSSKPDSVKASQPNQQQAAAIQTGEKSESTQNIVVRSTEEKLKERAAEAVNLYPADLGGQYGYIDKTGKVAIKPQFRAALAFANGLAPAQDIKERWGYINPKGEWAIPAKYEVALPFAENLGVVRLDGKYGAVDKSGKVVIAPTYVGMSQFSDGVSAVLMTHQHNGPFVSTAWGFIDREGKYIISPRFENVTTFADGLIGLRKLGGNWGFIDLKQQQVIVPQFSEVSGFSEGLSGARDRNMRWGFIDRSGTFVIKPQFINVTPFSEGKAGAFDFDKRKWGFVDRSGKYVIEPRFEEATQFVNGMAMVQLDGKETYIDTTGKIVWQASTLKPAEDNKVKLNPTEGK
jgi:hypothetical protein